jgi:hypothetical protein
MSAENQSKSTNIEAGFTHANFVAIARDLIEITDTILKEVVAKTERAALEIGEKVHTISTFSDDQAKNVREILTNVYQDGTKENEEIKTVLDETNSYVDQMVESAKVGDFDKVKQLGDSERYTKLKNQSGLIAKHLERLAESDKQMSEILAPVIMALQFQDHVRQSLENVIHIFDHFFLAMSCIAHEKLPTEIAEEFWNRVETQFTSTKDRNVVRRVVYGNGSDVEDEVEQGGSIFF